MIRMLLIIGVEGAGHHLLRAVLGNFLSQDTVVDKGDYYPLLEQRWDILEERLPIDLVRRELQRIVQRYTDMGITHFFEDTSFPFDKPRTPLRRPDILDLMDLTDALLELRLLVLYRDPVSAVYSALRRGFSNNPCHEAKIAEDNHLYIERQLSQLHPEYYRTVQFEQILATPTACIRPIADWFGIDASLLANGVSRVGECMQRDQIPANVRLSLEQFFTPSRVGQWKSLYSRNPILEEDELHQENQVREP